MSTWLIVLPQRTILTNYYSTILSNYSSTILSNYYSTIVLPQRKNIYTM